jgi:hypothetical protein
VVFLNRTYRHFLILGASDYKKLKRKKVEKTADSPKSGTSWVTIRALLTLAWRQGVVRKTRFQFWINLFSLLRQYPNVVTSYLSVCAQGEHFLEYRQIVRDQIEAQLELYLANRPVEQESAEASVLEPEKVLRT